MAECFKNYFIYNDEVKSNEKFDNKILHEGKSLYEVIRIVEGIPVFLENHLNRLENSSKMTGMKVWLTNEEIKNRIKKLVEANELMQGSIKSIFNFKDEGNTFIAYFMDLKYPTKEEYENGISTVFYHGERTNPNAKILNANFRETVDRILEENNAYEALLVDRNQIITEGSRSNVFMVKNNKLYTSPVKSVLPGITRQMILNICEKCNIEVVEEKITYDGITTADGAFISSTPVKIVPIKNIGDTLLHSSENVIIKKIMEEYDELTYTYIQDNK